MLQPREVDHKTVVLLNDHPGWKLLKELFYNRIDTEMEVVSQSPLHDIESVARHNLRIGRIQAWQEILEFPDKVMSNPTSTV